MLPRRGGTAKNGSRYPAKASDTVAAELMPLASTKVPTRNATAGCAKARRA